MSAVDGIHFSTEAHFAWAELLVHVVQGMCHGINSINHKLHFSLLLIIGVFSYPLLICRRNGYMQDYQTNLTHYHTPVMVYIYVSFMRFFFQV